MKIFSMIVSACYSEAWAFAGSHGMGRLVRILPVASGRAVLPYLRLMAADVKPDQTRPSAPLRRRT